MNKSTTQPKRSKRVAVKARHRKESFPVVGLGASAGGLEAVTQLLRHLPPDTGMGFVVVQHLVPTHESALTTLLSCTTKMIVSEARNGMRVEPGHVYVIPPDKKMGIEKGTLWLLPREHGGDLHAPVDYFFRTLAADQGAQAIGIVLSGTGSDGTLGLEEIKAAGGITLVQSEASAKHAGMPASAAGSGCADYILPPEEIAAQLIRVGQQPNRGTACTMDSDSLLLIDADELQPICALLHVHSGVDFSHYKPSTLRRRISRRMVLQNLGTLKEYVGILRSQPAEVEALFQDILICVTGFFRDAKMFDLLKKRFFHSFSKTIRRMGPFGSGLQVAPRERRPTPWASRWWNF